VTYIALDSWVSVLSTSDSWNAFCLFGLLLSLPSVLGCFWLGSTKGICPVKKLSGGMLACLCVWVKVQICIWPSWCHCHSLFLAPVNPDWFYLPGFTFLVLAHTGSPGQNPRGLKNCCVCACGLMYLGQNLLLFLIHVELSQLMHVRVCRIVLSFEKVMCLQCFDAVGWASGLQWTEWWLGYLSGVRCRFAFGPDWF